MITTNLRILLVEDVKTDADLISFHLKGMVRNPEIKLVDSLADLRNELLNFIPDLVISDYNLPACNGLEVLEVTKATLPDTAFIFLTGAVDDDEVAANTVLSGANGFILKKHMEQLSQKLLPLLKRVVVQMEGRREIHERRRQNRISMNKIYGYLDKIKAENEQQRENLRQIRENIDIINRENQENA